VKPLVIIYWLRLVLGIVAAGISTAVTILHDELSYTIFMNGITIALAIYLVSYYILKAKFGTQVEKQSKIMTQGIGIYFFTWLVLWVLLYSILKGPPAITV
jgi:hypothetical protein